MASDEGKKTSEGPSVTADTWFAMAVAAFLITLVIGCFAAAWVFSAAKAPLMVQRAQAFTPFGAALLAIVTFCTVAWRGVLNTQQLQQQADQLKQQIRQNDANDSSNFAKLLQEGAKLIADRDKLPQVIAGISTLEIVIRDPQARYAIESMDLLGDLLVENYGFEQLNRVNRSAIRGLNLGASLGFTSRVDGFFRRPESSPTNAGMWGIIKGLNSLTFTGGSLSRKAYTEMQSAIRKLRLTRIIQATVDLNSPKFETCHFDNCTIKLVSVPELKKHRFTRCDFSGATVMCYPDTSFKGVDLKEGRNYFEEEAPRTQNGDPLGFLFLTKDELDELEDSDVRGIEY